MLFAFISLIPSLMYIVIFQRIDVIIIVRC